MQISTVVPMPVREDLQISNVRFICKCGDEHSEHLNGKSQCKQWHGNHIVVETATRQIPHLRRWPYRKVTQ